METMFINFLNMSIAASWIIIAILLFRIILKKAPKSIHRFLWLLVGIRLVIPFSFESALSLIPDVEPVRIENETVIDANNKTVTSDMIPQEKIDADNLNLENFTAHDSSVPESNNTLIKNILLMAASIAWICGMIVMLIYCLASMLVLNSKMKTAVRLRDNIWQCDYTISPFILGIIKPKIYIPFKVDEAELTYIIAHESTHLKHRDHIVKLVAFLLLAVYWFNPLVWIAYICLCRDIEFACDERVVHEMNMAEKKAYSETLLSCSVNASKIAAYPLAFGEVGVKARIKSVLKYKKPKFWVVTLSVCVCILIGICFLTNPKAKTTKQTDSPANTADIASTEEETIAASETEINTDNNSSYIGYLGYSGYMDECTEWIDYQSFVDCDYDNDGLTDRVYRTYEGGEFCHYAIEFGNGEILDFDKDVYDIGWPVIMGMDLTGAKVNDIIFSLSYGTSTEPRSFGDLVIYEKKDNKYQMSTLPFAESEEGYTQNLELAYNGTDGQAIEVVVPQEAFSQVIPIEEELWEGAFYKNNFTTGEVAERPVWSYYVIQNNGQSQLVCKVHLFDKWSNYGLDVYLSYVEGKFEIDNIVYLEEEFTTR